MKDTWTLLLYSLNTYVFRTFLVFFLEITYFHFVSFSWPDIPPGLSSLPPKLHVQPHQDAKDQHDWDVEHAG